MSAKIVDRSNAVAMNFAISISHLPNSLMIFLPLFTMNIHQIGLLFNDSRCKDREFPGNIQMFPFVFSCASDVKERFSALFFLFLKKRGRRPFAAASLV